jgi:hypothetical protein
MPTTVETASASARESMRVSTVKVASRVAMFNVTAKGWVPGEGRHAPVVAAPGNYRSPVNAASRVEARMEAMTVEPRPGANKDSAREPAWSIVAVRCAAIRVIVVVTVRARRRRPHIARTNSYLDANALGMGIRCNQQS